MLNRSYHKSLDTLPIIQWAKLNESIDKKKPEFRYLLKLNRMLYLTKISRRTLKKLIKHYETLIYNIKNIDLRLLSYYREYLIDTMSIIVANTKNKLRELNNWDKLKIKYEKNNKLFKQYASFLDSNYKNFKVNCYILREDYEEYYKEYFKDYSNISDNINKYLKSFFNKVKQVYTPQHYIASCIKVSDIASYLDIVTSSIFFKAFYKIENIEIKSILDHSDKIKPYYMQFKQYDRYILERSELFDLNVINAKPQNDYDFHRDLADLSVFLKLNIDEFETSVNKYASYQNRASREIEYNRKPKHA
jgi:hypothetical protein